MTNVTVDPDIFSSQGEPYLEPLDGWWGPSPFFLVISDETDKAAEALHVAIGRCMRVDGNGNELTAAEMATTGEYTAKLLFARLPHREGTTGVSGHKR